MRGSVSAILLRPVLAAATDAAARGEILAACDLTDAMLADDAWITPAQLCVAWSTLARLAGDSAVALRVAAATPPGAFGIVEYVCRSAPSLGDALRQWVRFLNLLDDAVEVGFVVEGEQACVRVIRESEAPAPQAHELCFALLVAQARRLCALPVNVRRVAFAHRRDDAGPYAEWFRAPVTFGAARTELVFERSDLANRLATADPGLLAILTRAAEDQARAGHAPPGVAAQVRRLLAVGLREEDADIDALARKLGLTARSLQRRLKDEGTTFQAVREATRRSLAERYLAEDLSPAEISFLLGFSEPSAFFRAFRRWTGTTPSEHRAGLSP